MPKCTDLLCVIVLLDFCIKTAAEQVYLMSGER